MLSYSWNLEKHFKASNARCVYLNIWPWIIFSFTFKSLQSRNARVLIFHKVPVTFCTLIKCPTRWIWVLYMHLYLGKHCSGRRVQQNKGMYTPLLRISYLLAWPGVHQKGWCTVTQSSLILRHDLSAMMQGAIFLIWYGDICRCTHQGYCYSILSVSVNRCHR